MKMPVWKCIFSQNYFKLYYPVTVNINYLSTTVKVYAKKKFSIKNNFTFQEDFQKTFNKIASENSDISPDAAGIVSADLLSNGKESRRRPTNVSQSQRSRKPSLCYRGEILFGIHPVYLALLQKKRTFYHLYTREADTGEDSTSKRSEIIKLAQSMDIPVSFVDNRGLKILAPDAVHQGVCLDSGYLPLPSWNEEHHAFDASERRPVWLILDEILDPMNVGAIMRSAHYFGVEKLFTLRENCCKLSPTVSKASSGSLEVIDIYQIDNLEDFVKKRKDDGWCIVSTIAYCENKSKFDAPIVSATQFNESKPTIFILGNEGRGVSRTILKLCDFLISIEPGRKLPQGMDSLNVSVATGVLLYILNSSNNIKQ